MVILFIVGAPIVSLLAVAFVFCRDGLATGRATHRARAEAAASPDFLR